MLSRSNTRERPRIEPDADGASKSTMSATDSLRFHWPEYLMEAGESGSPNSHGLADGQAVGASSDF